MPSIFFRLMRIRLCKSGAVAVVVAAAEPAVAVSIAAARFVAAACIVAVPRIVAAPPIVVVPPIAEARSFEEAWWVLALVLLAIMAAMAVAVIIAIRTTKIAATRWRSDRGRAVVTSGAACRDGAALRRRGGARATHQLSVNGKTKVAGAV